MKLKDDFITQDIEGTQFMVSIAAKSFRGIVRSNETAAFIVNCLKSNTTKAEIVDNLMSEYDVDRETVETDVDCILEKLRSINALEE